jgi:hypothetical protein
LFNLAASSIKYCRPTTYIRKGRPASEIECSEPAFLMQDLGEVSLGSHLKIQEIGLTFTEGKECKLLWLAHSELLSLGLGIM